MKTAHLCPSLSWFNDCVTKTDTKVCMKSLKNPQSSVLLWTQQLYYTCCFIIALTEGLASVGARVTGCMFDERVCMVDVESKWIC